MRLHRSSNKQYDRHRGHIHSRYATHSALVLTVQGDDRSEPQFGVYTGCVLGCLCHPLTRDINSPLHQHNAGRMLCESGLRQWLAQYPYSPRFSRTQG